MAKNYNIRSIKKHRTYTIESAALAIGVHIQTVRSWIKNGLPCLKSKKPYLILGAHLKAFLEDQNTKGKTSLGPNQMYCLSCKGGKIPAQFMADYTSTTVIRGTLKGLCPDCGHLMNRFARLDKITKIAPNLDVKYPDGLDSLNDTSPPPSNTHLQKAHTP